MESIALFDKLSLNNKPKRKYHAPNSIFAKTKPLLKQSYTVLSFNFLPLKFPLSRAPCRFIFYIKKNSKSSSVKGNHLRPVSKRVFGVSRHVCIRFEKEQTTTVSFWSHTGQPGKEKKEGGGKKPSLLLSRKYENKSAFKSGHAAGVTVDIKFFRFLARSPRCIRNTKETTILYAHLPKDAYTYKKLRVLAQNYIYTCTKLRIHTRR